jgi:hypothetical protein
MNELIFRTPYMHIQKLTKGSAGHLLAPGRENFQLEGKRVT